jgi:hypothetical protein
MELTISWTNRTSNADSIKLYRKEEPFLESALGEAIATLPGNATSFTDEVEFGKTYYYRTQTIKTGDTVTSAQLKVIASTYTGPGPQTLISGDTECGFYGEVTEQELDNPALLASRIIGNVIQRGTDPAWLKFSYKGKIIYIAKQMIFNTTYQALYDAKVIDGKRGLPQYPLNSDPTLEQYREEVIRGQRFIVRTPQGDNSSKLGFLVTGGSSTLYTDDVAGFRDCEYTDLIFAVVDNAGIKNIKRKLANYPVAEVYPAYQYFDYMQELVSSYPLVRSCRASANSAYAANRLTIALTVTSATVVVSGGNNYVYGNWRPVLEWIGPATI